MHLTIYINNKPVYLCNKLTPALEKLHHQPQTVFIDELDTHSIKAMLREIDLPEMKQGIFLYDDLELLKKKFFRKFQVHVAGGGLVINNTGKLLLIYRRGFWDLPKGHLDKGETIEACAVREVQEETGLKRVSISSFLTTTYHSYWQGTRHIMKESHWYLMKLKTNEPLIPQTEEDIEKIEWVSPKDVNEFMVKAYPSVRDVVNQYLNT